ncbi:MAG TPA: hypothetical protein VEP46_03705 [Vicinamibacterales bacterium]|nr:hypothetical protein [Vicinamibacterales bacterium]
MVATHTHEISTKGQGDAHARDLNEGAGSADTAIGRMFTLG